MKKRLLHPNPLQPLLKNSRSNTTRKPNHHPCLLPRSLTMKTTRILMCSMDWRAPQKTRKRKTSHLHPLSPNPNPNRL